MPEMKIGLVPKVTFHFFLTEKMEEHFDPTDESDYIYDGGHIIYYRGTVQRPEVPQYLGSSQVKSIGAEAFSGCNIKAVKLPEGMEEIM